jgi:hypothetical protein
MHQVWKGKCRSSIRMVVSTNRTDHLVSAAGKYHHRNRMCWTSFVQSIGTRDRQLHTRFLARTRLVQVRVVVSESGVKVQVVVGGGVGPVMAKVMAKVAVAH